MALVNLITEPIDEISLLEPLTRRELQVLNGYFDTHESCEHPRPAALAKYLRLGTATVLEYRERLLRRDLLIWYSPIPCTVSKRRSFLHLTHDAKEICKKARLRAVGYGAGAGIADHCLEPGCQRKPEVGCWHHPEYLRCWGHSAPLCPTCAFAIELKHKRESDWKPRDPKTGLRL